MRLIAITIAALAFTGTASAHIIGSFHGKTLKATIAYQEKQLAHTSYVCARGTGEVKHWHCQAARWVARELAETRARMAPAVGHRSMWLCIHSREGAWNANTGNGYFGGLQMTWGWGAFTDGAHLHSPEEQMRVAELGYRQSGYSTAWLFGQWPNTAPPCVG